MASQDAEAGVRGDRVRPPTRALAYATVPFLVVAFAVLYPVPGDTGRLFAWHIASPLTAMLLGSAYLGGAYFFLRAARATAAGDPRRFFHATYTRTTRAVAEEIARGGFMDNEWVHRWDLVFADFYLAALEADRAGRPVPGPWRVTFDAGLDQPDLPPVRHVLYGMNAHINYDLPQALLGVIDEASFDDEEVLDRRLADHRRLDMVLLSRIGAEHAELVAVSHVTLFDRLIAPANRAATGRFLAESRGKVWRNARALDRARRAGGAAYAAALADLERLCAARVRDLAAPGPVLLRLARRGFGVLLPGA